MATIPTDPSNPDDQPESFPGSDTPAPPVFEPGDPGDAPSDSPTPTQAPPCLILSPMWMIRPH